MNNFQDIGYLIKQINDNLLRNVNQYVAEFELTFQQFQIIDFILNQNKDVSQKDIEQYLQVAHPTVVGLLKRMEIKNFIICKQDEKDKRIKIVYLTQKAYDLLEEVKQTKLKVEEQLFKGFDSQQQTDIINNLQILFENTKMEELL
jgi:DNA-binding MarR family transcriptional regulator